MTMMKARSKRGISAGLYPNEEDSLRQQSERWKSGHPDWVGILRRDSALWKSARTAAEGGPRVLIATSIGGLPSLTIFESMLAVALTLRGARVHILLCDAALPACFLALGKHFPDMQEFVKHGPTQRMCGDCFPEGYKIFQSLGLPIHRYSELISGQELEKARDLSARIPRTAIGEYHLDGVASGEHAMAGALRFYGRGNLESEPHGESILRRFFNASLLTVYAVRRLLKTFPFRCVCCTHGIYVPHGVMPGVARHQNVRSVAWSPTYRKQTFIFSHDDTYHHTMLSEPTTNWENMSWTPETEAELLDYLKSRWDGTRDWISIHEKSQGSESDIAAGLSIDPSKPCIGLLTNVVWEAQAHYRGNAFPNMVEWVLESVRYFAKRTDLQLIIRVHPAELGGGMPSRQPIINEIRTAFPNLPANVFIIPPESPISTYAVMLRCDSVIIYGTKTGVELTSLGVPVIVAGEAWIRNKGVTLDASSPDEYFELLNRLPLKKRLDEGLTLRARKYAYHFFFRRMIPVESIGPSPQPYKGVFNIQLELYSLEELLPGRSIGLDVICNGILNGDEFIYPAELQRETTEDYAQVSTEARVGVALQVAATLDRRGELERMRGALLKGLREIPWMAGDPWARFSIARKICRLALMSASPIATLRAFCAEARAIAGGRGLTERLRMRRLLADVLTEAAIALGADGSPRAAGYAAAWAILHDPTRLRRKVVLKLLGRSVLAVLPKRL